MHPAFLYAVPIVALGIAFLHGALPAHWMPFVLAAHRQNWGYGKSLFLTAVGGLDHTIITMGLGILVVWAGFETRRFASGLFPFIAGGALVTVGMYYIFRQPCGASRLRFNWIGEGRHGRKMICQTGVSDVAVVIALLAMLTSSPSEGFLPVYLSVVRYGWSEFLLLSLTLALGTISAMVLLASFTLKALEQFEDTSLERYEGVALGVLLIFLGVATMVFDR